MKSRKNVKSLNWNLNSVKAFFEKYGILPVDNEVSEDGKTYLIVYKPEMYVNCSEENPVYYSKEGELYLKSTDEKVIDRDGFYS